MNSLEERQKILVVDDSKFNQELIMEILGEEYQYVLANDGLEAISILQKDWTIDLMLLDINMPRMNGNLYRQNFCGCAFSKAASDKIKGEGEINE